MGAGGGGGFKRNNHSARGYHYIHGIPDCVVVCHVIHCFDSHYLAFGHGICLGVPRQVPPVEILGNKRGSRWGSHIAAYTNGGPFSASLFFKILNNKMCEPDEMTGLSMCMAW